MSSAPAIPRDSCPFCGERVGQPWWKYQPGRISCKVCGKTSRVALGPGGVGIVTGMLASGAFTVGFLGLVGPAATIIGAVFVYLSVTSATTRLLVRLDPVEYGDRGGPT